MVTRAELDTALRNLLAAFNTHTSWTGEPPAEVKEACNLIDALDAEKQEDSGSEYFIDYHKLVTDGSRHYQYRAGTAQCVAFKRGAEWLRDQLHAKRPPKPRNWMADLGFVIDDMWPAALVQVDGTKREATRFETILWRELMRFAACIDVQTRAEVPADGPYCVLCEQAGHRTTDCHATHGMNNARQKELFRLTQAKELEAELARSKPVSIVSDPNDIDRVMRAALNKDSQ